MKRNDIIYEALGGKKTSAMHCNTCSNFSHEWFLSFYGGILNFVFQHLDSIFNRILVCLAVTDNIFVLTCLLGSVQRYFFTESPFLDLLFLHVVYPVSTKSNKLGSNDT